MTADFAIACPACSRRLRVASGSDGKKIRCRACGTTFVNQSVPTPATEIYERSDPERTAALNRQAPSLRPAAANAGSAQATLVQLAGSAQATLVQLGRFTLEKEVGRGGFGVVYRATDSVLGRTVALKVLNASKTDAEGIARFVLEASSAAKLRHPNIVAVHDSGRVADGRCFIASEFVQGRPLTKFTDEARQAAGETPLDRETKVRWIRDLAGALAYAHSEGVVHRDVKPDNILIDESHLRPQLTDFGLAKRLDVEMPTLTQTGMILGTPSYMSPEQARGEGDLVGPASDQYSLGVVLFELLSGSRLYQGDALQIIRRLADQDESPQLRAVAPDVPKDLAAICSKTMEKRPRDRYANLAALAEDLTRWLEGRTVSARPISLPARSLRWSRRNPVAASLIGAVVLVTAIGFASVGLALGQAVVAERRADDNAEKAIDEAKKATSALRVVQAASYRANVKEALRNLEAGEIQASRTLLDACPVELRDWEWRYANTRQRSLDNLVVLLGSGAFAFSRQSNELLACRSYRSDVAVYRTTDGTQLESIPIVNEGEQKSISWRDEALDVDSFQGNAMLVMSGHNRTNDQFYSFHAIDLRTRQVSRSDLQRGEGYLPRNARFQFSPDHSKATMWGGSMSTVSGRSRYFTNPAVKVIDIGRRSASKFVGRANPKGEFMPVESIDTRTCYAIKCTEADSIRTIALVSSDRLELPLYECPYPFYCDVQCASVHDATRRLYLGASDGSVHAFSLSPSAVGSAHTSEGEQDVATSGNAAKSHIWTTSSAHAGGTTSLTISKSGKIVVSAGVDRTLKIWDAASGAALYSRKLSGEVEELEISHAEDAVAIRLGKGEMGSSTVIIPVSHAPLALYSRSPVRAEAYAFLSGKHVFVDEAQWSLTGKVLWTDGSDWRVVGIGPSWGAKPAGLSLRDDEGYGLVGNLVLSASELQAQGIEYASAKAAGEKSMSVSPMFSAFTGVKFPPLSEQSSADPANPAFEILGFSTELKQRVTLAKKSSIRSGFRGIASEVDVPELQTLEGRTLAQLRGVGVAAIAAYCFEERKVWGVLYLSGEEGANDSSLYRMGFYSSESGGLVGQVEMECEWSVLDSRGFVSPGHSRFALVTESGVLVYEIRLDQKSSHRQALVSKSSGHSGAIVDVAFLGDSRIATCGEDGTVRVWAVETGEEMLTLGTFEEKIVGISAADDGETLYVGTADGVFERFSTISE